MAIVLVTASEESYVQGLAPSAADIATALERARLAGAEDVRGTWVGPGPRITRTDDLPIFKTTFAWPYAWPTRGPWREGAPLQALAIELRDAVARELRTIGGDWGAVRVGVFDPADHGAISQWESGELSRTRTRNQFAFFAGRLGEVENPIGPTTPGTRPPTLRDLTEDTLTSLAPWALAGLVLWAWSSNRRSR